MRTSALSSSIWLIGEKLFTMGINLLVMQMLATSLGPDSFGKLNYLLAIVALLAPITSLGLNSLITKEVLTRADQQGSILGTGLAIRIVGGIIAFILIVCATLYTDLAKGSGSQLVLLAFANIFTAAFIIDFYMQAHMLNQSVVKLRLVVMLIANATKIFGWFTDAGLNFYLGVAAAEFILTGIGFLFLYQLKTKQLRRLKFKLTEGQTLIKKSGWLILSGLAAIIYLKIDQVMLGLLSSQSQVGLYAVAAKLSEVWYFIPTAIVLSFFPKLIQLRNSEGYGKTLQQLNDLLFFIALFVAIATTFFAKPVIMLVFGDEYSGAGLVLSIHIWAGIFIFMRALLSKWLIAENLLKFSLVTQVVGACFNVALNYWLIPEYGAVGAAIATVLSYAAASYFTLFFHRSTLPMAIVMTKSLILPLRIITGEKIFINAKPRT